LTSVEMDLPENTYGYPGYSSTGSITAYDPATEPNDIVLLVKVSETKIAIDPSTYETLDGNHLFDFIFLKYNHTTGESISPCSSILNQLVTLLKTILIRDINGENVEQLLIDHAELQQLYLDLCVTTPGSAGGPTCDKPCERTCLVADEFVFKFKVNTFQDFLSFDCFWFEKRADFRCIITKENRTTNELTMGNEIFKGGLRKKDLMDCSSNPCVGKWIELDNTLSRYWEDWDSVSFVRFHFNWIELGNGTGVTFEEIEFTAGAKFKIDGVEFTAGVGFTISVTGKCNNMVDLFGTSAFYCDDADKPGQLYNTGK
jgi:hypothetical protein